MSSERPRLEVADLVRSHGQQLGQSRRLSIDQRRVMRHLASCRTAALGGHLDVCDACGHERPSYNSCRDRHCPKCQGTERARWLEQRLARLLPVPYFHVVFTVPSELATLILRNKRLGYATLFAAAAETLQTIARDPKRLGAQLSITAVLHSWAQNLLFHPHLHCVVSGGGLSPGGARWIPAREQYLLPVRVLARMFRGKFLAQIERAYRDGQLDLTGDLVPLKDRRRWTRLRRQLYQKEWVVYAKAPFGGPEHVFRYLGRYTHRVAISNYRLVRTNGQTVTIKARDRTDHHRTKQLTLSVERFLARFLLHLRPNRFVRIRHYGLVAGRNVDTKLATARRLLAKDRLRCQRTQPDREIRAAQPQQPDGRDLMVCPRCGEPRLRRQRILPDADRRWGNNLARASPATPGDRP
ncbi:MAG: IS91 family transposase [Woeseiaceae bacterium]